MFVHQTFGLVREQDAVGQPAMLPSSTVSPQALWRRSQPQSVLGAGSLITVDPPVGAHHPLFTIDRSWLAQPESRWEKRLQALALQAAQLSDDK